MEFIVKTAWIYTFMSIWLSLTCVTNRLSSMITSPESRCRAFTAKSLDYNLNMRINSNLLQIRPCLRCEITGGFLLLGFWRADEASDLEVPALTLVNWLLIVEDWSSFLEYNLYVDSRSIDWACCWAKERAELTNNPVCVTLEVIALLWQFWQIAQPFTSFSNSYP